MNSLADAVDQVVADLDRVLSADAFTALTDAERMDALRAAGDALRRVEAVIVATVAPAEPPFSDGFGCRSTNELLQRVARVDAPGASKMLKAASAVRREVALSSGERLPARYPEVREALLDGAIGVAGVLAATGPIDQAGDRIGVADRLTADAALAAFARGCPADADAGADAGAGTAPPATPEDIRQFAQALAMALDPDGAEPSDLRAQQQRFVTVGRLRDGVHPLRGNLLPDAAAQLQLIIDAQCNPKTDGPPQPGVVFRDSDAVAAEGDPGNTDPWNADPRAVIDARTAAQKRHDALAAAMGIAARHDEMPKLAGAAPTLVVQADVKDIATGAGWSTIAGSQAPVPLGVARQAACSGAIQRVLLDAGRIIGVSVTDRVFTVHQRRAIVARDRECLIPGCHVPASWCEIHHVIEHAGGGETHTDNGVPLCWWHHRSLDRSGWEIRMDRGIPQIRGPAWWDPVRRWRAPQRSLRLLQVEESGADELPDSADEAVAGGAVGVIGDHVGPGGRRPSEAQIHEVASDVVRSEFAEEVRGAAVRAVEEALELAECEPVELVGRFLATEGAEVDAVAQLLEDHEVRDPLLVQEVHRDGARGLGHGIRAPGRHESAPLLGDEFADPGVGDISVDDVAPVPQHGVALCRDGAVVDPGRTMTVGAHALGDRLALVGDAPTLEGGQGVPLTVDAGEHLGGRMHPHEVVVEAEEGAADTRVALPTRAPAELCVETA